MEATATLKNLRMSPSKVRLVADLVRGRRALESLDQLKFSPKAAARPVAKVIKSAMHNATNNLSLKAEDLVVKCILVDPAPTLKRIKPRARGKADRINKRACHIHVIVSD